MQENPAIVNVSHNTFMHFVNHNQKPYIYLCWIMRSIMTCERETWLVIRFTQHATAAFAATTPPKRTLRYGCDIALRMWHETGRLAYLVHDGYHSIHCDHMAMRDWPYILTKLTSNYLNQFSELLLQPHSSHWKKTCHCGLEEWFDFVKIKSKKSKHLDTF